MSTLRFHINIGCSTLNPVHVVILLPNLDLQVSTRLYGKHHTFIPLPTVLHTTLGPDTWIYCCVDPFLRWGRNAPIFRRGWFQCSMFNKFLSQLTATKFRALGSEAHE